MAPKVARALLTLLAVPFLLITAGCHDLTLPPAGLDGGRGPDVSIVQPPPMDSAHPLLLSSRVVVDAADADGVASVDIYCGNSNVATLRTEPYDSVIDFTGCRPFAVAPVAPQTLPTLTLDVIATDTLGHSSKASVTVFFDTRLPVLVADVPQYASPGGNITFHVKSGLALDGLPRVKVGGSFAVVSEDADSDPMTPSYTVTQGPLPEIGVDALPAGTPVTFEVLTETSRQIPIIILGTGTNGNVTELDTSTQVSRVRFDIPSPGNIVPGTGDNHTRLPVAFARGLAVPLEPLLNDDNRYLPAVIGTDGRFEAFSAPDISASSTLYGLTSSGVLVSRTDPKTGKNNLELTGAGDGGATGLFPIYPTALGNARTRVGDSLCSEAPDGGCNVDLQCIGSDGGTVLKGVQSGAVCNAPAPTVSVASGLGYFSIPGVSPQTGAPTGLWVVGSLDTTLRLAATFYTTTLPGLGTCTFSGVDRVQPSGEGAFAVELVGSCGGVGGQRYSFLLDSTGTVLGRFDSARAGAPLPILALLPDRTLLTYRNESGSTVFERWHSTTAGTVQSPVASATVPALLTAPIDSSIWQEPGFAWADGSMAFGMYAGGTRGAVVTFNASFQPRYVYFYPRPVSQPFTTIPPYPLTFMLRASDRSELMYLLDTANERVVGLSR